MLSDWKARGTWRQLSTAPRPPHGIGKTRGRFVQVGLPLLLFVVGGFALLTQFVEGKYEARDHMIKSQTTRAFDLEQEHKKMTEKLALDDFELKPVPNPDDEAAK